MLENFRSIRFTIYYALVLFEERKCSVIDFMFFFRKTPAFNSCLFRDFTKQLRGMLKDSKLKMRLVHRANQMNNFIRHEKDSGSLIDLLCIRPWMSKLETKKR